MAHEPQVGLPRQYVADPRPARVTAADVDRMVGKLFLTTRAQQSAFWVLLVLASVIATAGVISDSTATVIGAMIVAPLMTPILGTAVAVVLADRRQLVTSVALVVAGAVVVIGIAYLMGLLVSEPVVAQDNSQVAGRVSPRIIDLVAALATGVVGAFAQVRSDVSDTLPGVAIAISLVPPLAVVGLTLESGAPGQAAGALLLFATNVTAIIATGTLVLLRYRVRNAAVLSGRRVGRMHPMTGIVLGALVVAVLVPLGAGTYSAVRDQKTVSTARAVGERWALSRSVELGDVSLREGVLQMSVVGRTPDAVTSLRQALDDAGLADVRVHLSLVDGSSSMLPPSRRP